MKKNTFSEKGVFSTIMASLEKKEFALLLMKREIYLRYKYRTLGILWGVFQPLFLSFIISFSIGKFTENTLISSYYFLSVYIGFIFWTYFSSTIAKGSTSIITNRSLIQGAPFPHIILPFSIMGVGLVDLFFSLSIAFLLSFFLGFFSIFVLLILLSLLLLLITSLGFSVLFAVLYAKFSDLREILSFTTTVLFYLSPIIYPVRIIPEQFHMFLYINPMVGVIEIAKAGLLHQALIPWTGLLISYLSSSILLYSSIKIFKKLDKTLVDIL